MVLEGLEPVQVHVIRRVLRYAKGMLSGQVGKLMDDAVSSLVRGLCHRLLGDEVSVADSEAATLPTLLREGRSVAQLRVRRSGILCAAVAYARGFLVVDTATGEGGGGGQQEGQLEEQKQGSTRGRPCSGMRIPTTTFVQALEHLHACPTSGGGFLQLRIDPSAVGGLDDKHFSLQMTPKLYTACMDIGEAVKAISHSCVSLEEATRAQTDLVRLLHTHTHTHTHIHRLPTLRTLRPRA